MFMGKNRHSLPIIVIDIDNTVADHNSRVLEFVDPISGEIDRERANAVDIVSQDRVIPGAQKAVKRLSKQYRIYWLTTRKKHLVSVTKAWLTKHGFQIDKIIFVHYFNDKIEELKKIKPILFIDDLKFDHFSGNPKIATMIISLLESNDIPYHMFNNDWCIVLDKLANHQNIS